jgi:hypothetical protein
MDSRPTLDETMEAADILRGMLDDEQDKNRVLKERLKELEILLLENGIAIPNYGIWHGELPYV